MIFFQAFDMYPAYIQCTLTQLNRELTVTSDKVNLQYSRKERVESREQRARRTDGAGAELAPEFSMF